MQVCTDENEVCKLSRPSQVANADVVQVRPEALPKAASVFVLVKQVN
jgi:hypothetical protein